MDEDAEQESPASLADSKTAATLDKEKAEEKVSRA